LTWCSTSWRHWDWELSRAARVQARRGRGRRPFGRGRQARSLVGQVMVSLGGHGRRRWPIWSQSRDLPALAVALGQALTTLDPAARVATTPRRQRLQTVCSAGSGSSWSCCPALGPRLVRKKSARSPQDVHKRSLPTDIIRHHPCRSEALWRANVQVRKTPEPRLHRGCRRFEPGRAHSFLFTAMRRQPSH